MFIIWFSIIAMVRAFPSNFQSENILNGTSDKPFIFFHIPKTGGSTAKGFLFHQLYNQLGKPYFFSNYNGLPGSIHEAEVTKDKKFRETFDCSVAIISHFSPKDLGISFFTNALGIHGLSSCPKRWWDNEVISEYFNLDDSGTELNGLLKVSEVRDEIRNGNKSAALILKRLVTKERDFINFDKLAVDVVKNSNCMVVFREPISRMWSWYHFFKYPKQSNVSFYEYVDKFGVEGMYNLTGKSIQSTVVGDAQSLLRETIFEQCFIGVQEHYGKVKEFLHTLHPINHLSEQHDTFPKHRFSASIKTMEEKLDDFPMELRNQQLAHLLIDDAKLWKRAYYHVKNIIIIQFPVVLGVRNFGRSMIKALLFFEVRKLYLIDFVFKFQDFVYYI